jgi:lysyl-tRNA synthetase class 2
MASLSELRTTRLQKLEHLRRYGMRPFETATKRTHTITDVIDQFESLRTISAHIVLAGRIMVVRGQGAILFVQLWDGTDGFQAVLQRDHMGDELFQLFVDTVDGGDFIECEGELFTTNRGQDSLRVSGWSLLSKSLLPLPDKWHGLADEDERYRKRYLELISDITVYDRFKLRSLIVRYIRNFFDSLGFVEVETPILQSQAGGAMARTFDTFHEDLQIPMVLRISLELEHKMLMAGGFPAIYEIGKNFRNEGSDPTHIQEFTMIEWYWAYHTLEDNMRITEKLLKGIIEDVCDGKSDFVVYDKNGDAVRVSCAGQWPRVRFDDLLREHAGIDCITATLDVVRTTAVKWGMKADEASAMGRGNLLDFIFKKSARNRIINPTFVTHYPGDLKPLAQQYSDGTAAVTQLIIAGSEITNQYAELIDPLVQRQLLEDQSAAKAGGDDEAMEIDERFLTAMEHGMPPMTGFGMGIDRLVAILTEQRNLRETIFFPIMRPETQV